MPQPAVGCRPGRTRQELLEATEAKLEAIVQATHAPGASSPEVAKHFRYEITEDAFTFERDEEAIAQEAALDRIHVVPTRVPEQQLDSGAQ